MYHKTVPCITANLEYWKKLHKVCNGTLPPHKSSRANFSFRSLGPLERGLSRHRWDCYRVPLYISYNYSYSEVLKIFNSDKSREVNKFHETNELMQDKAGNLGDWGVRGGGGEWGEWGGGGVAILDEDRTSDQTVERADKKVKLQKLFRVGGYQRRSQNEEKNGTAREKGACLWKHPLKKLYFGAVQKENMYIYLRKFYYRQRIRILPDKHMYSCQLYCCKPWFGDIGVSRPYIHPHLCRCQILDLARNQSLP